MAGADWARASAALALSAMLAEESPRAPSIRSRRGRRTSRPKVKRVIMLFMFGGPSHLDTFDPKPLLARDSGRPLPPEKRPRVVSFPNRMGNLVGSPFAFRQHGESGTLDQLALPRTWPSGPTTSA